MTLHVHEEKLMPALMTVDGFWALAEPEPNSGCWIWMGTRTRKGYGKVSFHSRSRHAHRVALIIGTRKSIDGLEIDHRCRNRACVNPAHLEIVSHRENVHRGWAARMPGWRPFRSLALEKERRQRRRAFGLCVRCPRPLVKPDGCYCTVHRDEVNARGRRRTALARSSERR